LLGDFFDDFLLARTAQTEWRKMFADELFPITHGYS
jgi:hypothetical protein